MKESYDEGVAIHIGPESCVAARKDSGEALTGGSAGWVLSLENNEPVSSADALLRRGRQHHGRR